jgi:hypothetical protein
MTKRTYCFTICFLLLAWEGDAFAQVPEGYYDSADTSSPQALRDSVHEIIDDHQRFPYTSSDTDTWDVLELADEDLFTKTPASQNGVVERASTTGNTPGHALLVFPIMTRP